MQSALDLRLAPPTSPVPAAATAIADLLSADIDVSSQRLAEIMTEASGGSDANGLWTPRQAYDAIELAQTILVSRLPTIAVNQLSDRLAQVAELSARLPTQTRRTHDQIDRQQFSTPAPLALLASIAAELRPDDMLLEPSAGTGLLAAFAPQLARLILNETDPDRVICLRTAFPKATILQTDGAAIDATLGARRANVVLINPPFSSSSTIGQDRHTAARHLLAALRACEIGGRVVAIMPGWFTDQGSDARAFSQTLELARLRANITIDGRLYAKHGTTVTTRLMVYDLSTRSTDAVIEQAETLAALQTAVLKITAREVWQPSNPLSPALIKSEQSSLRRAPAMFGLRPIPRLPQQTPIARTGGGVSSIAFEILDQPAATDAQVGIYLPYRPSRIAFPDGREHPTALVESIAMGSITAPQPKGRPTLPNAIVARGVLSVAQLETVVYTASAHDEDLPGKFVTEHDGATLKASDVVAEDEKAATARSYRMGWFLGDGTGTGKGRQVAGMILDQWLRGNRRHVWISKTEALLEDARRDWTALGGLPLDIQPLSRWKLGETVEMAEGILYVTYATLRSSRADTSRLRQILAWCDRHPGEEQSTFEGVIAFDEAHAMQNASGGEGPRGTIKGSEQGIAGLKLQNRLPRARIVYVSATGASDVANLAYAGRLNLWGPATAFANRDAFVEGIRQGGVAAMELVSRDLKAQGLYFARALSFAGVEYEPLEHKLTPDQIRDYDAYADAWAIIHTNLEAALEATNVIDPISGGTLNAGAKGAARSIFESTKQRFFGQLLLSAKLPSLIPAMRRDLDDGNAVVVQLVSTAEAILNRRLAALEPDELEDLSIDLSPREYVIDYLQAGFPVVQMEIYSDEQGYLHSRPMIDEHGTPVVNPSAVAARASLIEQLCAMPPIATALDALIAAFGTDNIAEVTGRSRRLVTLADGRQAVERRSARSNVVETQAFMDGTKRVLVFSDAGGTGRSYHASLEARNQLRRIHYLLEPGWDAIKAIQGLGRTHRSAQASAPLFRPVTTDCRGERRFISTVARRLDSLGAITRGQRQTGGQNMFDPADNLESTYALDALHSWYRLLHDGKLASVNLVDFQAMTGLELVDRDTGALRDPLPPIQRWLNRLLALRIATQNAIFDEFLGLIETRVAAAREAGTLDLGVETVGVENFAIREDRTVRTDARSGATTHLLKIDLARKIPFTTLARALAIHDGTPDRVLLVNGRSGRAAIRCDGRAHVDEDGQATPTYDLYRPTRRDYIDRAMFEDTSWQEVDSAIFAAVWTRECEEHAIELKHETVYLMTGLLLPIWNKLPKSPVRVTRLVDTTGNSVLGREVPLTCLPDLARALGLDLDTRIGAVELVESVLRTGKPLPFVGIDQLIVKRSKVAGKHRLELTAYDPARLDWYKAQGCFAEIHQYRTRLYLPVNTASQVLDKLVGEA